MQPSSIQSEIPSDGLRGLREHWRSDLIAAFSVALVALPLGLGIAMASNVPPMAGVISAVIGGIFATFFRGSYVAINGPAAGLIVVILTAMDSLGEFTHVLGAIVVAGIIQIALGFLKLGSLGKVFPASVIHGMLAAIGVIIFGKQAHVALGQKTDAHSSLDVLFAIVDSVKVLDPLVTLISVTCLLLLLFHKKVKNKLVHFLPAPVWVMLVAIPLAVLLSQYGLDPKHMLTIDGSLQDSIVHPSFQKIGELNFWLAVMSITLVASIETLLASTAIDKLDPYKRQTNLDRDLVGVGLATLVAGCVGGLPIITVIVRSSVNINHGGQTRWANFFHGVIILVFLLFFMNVLSMIPLAALAAILVFTGFKLASPKVFQDAYRKGPEQLFILGGTLFFTLKYGLLEGIFLGVLLTLAIHLIRSRMPLTVFMRSMIKPEKAIISSEFDRHNVKISGLANFINLLRFKKTLDSIPPNQTVEIDLAQTNLVDHTVMEFFEDFAHQYTSEGGKCNIIGLDLHQSPSEHPHAMRVHYPPHQMYRLTTRQRDLKALCEQESWDFQPHLQWGKSEVLSYFAFFKSRPIEYRHNTIHGRYAEIRVPWTICDVTFDEGALIGAEVYQTTIQIIPLRHSLPKFVLEREELLDKLFVLSGYDEFDYHVYTDFSDKFVVKAPDEAAVREFLTQEMIDFFDTHRVYHLESSGKAILIKNFRLATPDALREMLTFSKELLHILPNVEDNET